MISVFQNLVATEAWCRLGQAAAKLAAVLHFGSKYSKSKHGTGRKTPQVHKFGTLDLFGGTVAGAEAAPKPPGSSGVLSSAE